MNLKPRLDPAQPVLLAVSGALAGGAGSSLHRLYPVPLTMVLLAKVRFRHRLNAMPGLLLRGRGGLGSDVIDIILSVDELVSQADPPPLR